MYYKIVSAGSQYSLREEVEKLLQQGWVCQGGVSFQIGSILETWAQALVKR